MAATDALDSPHIVSSDIRPSDLQKQVNFSCDRANGQQSVSLSIHLKAFALGTAQSAEVREVPIHL